MKKTILYGLSVAIMLISCNSDELLINQDGNRAIETMIQSDLEGLVSMGFDTLDYHKIGDFYVVEGDIMIHKDNVQRKVVTRQFHTTNTVTSGQYITIGVNNYNLLPAWANTLSVVAYIYSQYTGLAVKFVGVNTNADIVVSKQSMGDYTCAMGEFPGTNGKPGKNIYINSTFFQNIDSFLSTDEKVFLLMHEMGHNLGLRHSDCMVNGQGNGEYGRIQISGPPYNDLNSFMKSASCGYSWTSMPEYDELTLSTLFPEVEHAIHFYNTYLPDDHFLVSIEGHKLDRSIFPVNNTYAFRGWRNDPSLNSIFDYNTPIYTDRTLYPAWETKGSLISKLASSYNGHVADSFTLSSPAVVTLTVTITRGLNTWEELINDGDTYADIVGFDYTEQINIVDHVSISSTQTEFTYTKSIVLNPGTYYINAYLTTNYGQQDIVSGRHGHVQISAEYY